MSALLSSALARSIQLSARTVLRQAGYRQELRRSGEVRLALWSKTWRKTTAPYPKRLVLLPGWGDSPVSWLGVVAMMRPFVRSHYDEIVLFDFPGFPGSLMPDRAFHDMDLLLQAAHDALDSLKPHTLIGHSLGGWLSTHYAACCGNGARPAHSSLSYAGPEAIILANPSGVFGTDREAWRERIHRLVESGFDEYRGTLFAREPRWIRLAAPAMRYFFAREETRLFIRSVKDEHVVDELLGHVRAQVWLLWGEEDRLTTPSWLEGWKNGLGHRPPRGSFLRGVGHCPHLEAPAVTATMLTRFLKELNREGAGEPLAIADNRWWKPLP